MSDKRVREHSRCNNYNKRKYVIHTREHISFLQFSNDGNKTAYIEGDNTDRSEEAPSGYCFEDHVVSECDNSESGIVVADSEIEFSGIILPRLDVFCPELCSSV